MMKRGENPYKSLGDALARLRGRMQESLAEVSGAVEIDSDRLKLYEQGEDRPSEDILELLMTHFSVKDDEADRIWKLAGYDNKNSDEAEENPLQPQPVMLLPFDARVIYTDAMNVVIDKHGVVINFMQGNGAGQMPAARVGMSIEYAQKVADVLNDTIKTAKLSNIPKHLPAPKSKKRPEA